MAITQAFQVGDSVRVQHAVGALLSGQTGVVVKVRDGSPGHYFVHFGSVGLVWLREDVLERP